MFGLSEVTRQSLEEYLRRSGRKQCLMAILIAASSNKPLKAAYAVAFGGWRTSRQPVAALILLLAAAALAPALFMKSGGFAGGS